VDLIHGFWLGGKGFVAIAGEGLCEVVIRPRLVYLNLDDVITLEGIQKRTTL
jgi:hypothetical protein